MERNINGQRVNVNLRLKKLKRKYKLRRIAAGLLVVGTIFTVAACSKKDDKGFDFDQTSTTSLSDQYQQEYNVELSPEEELLANKMEVYDITRDQYQDAVKDKNTTDVEKVDSRVDLVSQTRTISDVCLEAIKLKVKEAVGVSDANITINRSDDNSTGKSFYTISIEKNGVELYTFRQNEIPDDMVTLINEVARLQGFNGTGENNAWNNEINDFNKVGNNLYNDTLQFLDNDYELNGNQLVSVDVEEKTR